MEDSEQVEHVEETEERAFEAALEAQEVLAAQASVVVLYLQSGRNRDVGIMAVQALQG